MKLNNLLGYFFGLAVALIALANPMHAFAAEPFETCNGLFNYCGVATDLKCFEAKAYGVDIGLKGSLTQACFPQENYKPCGKDGTCAEGFDCAVVQPLFDKTIKELRCLSINITPNEPNSPHECTTSDDCKNINKQCVNVIVVKDQWSDTLISKRRCLEVSKVNSALQEAGGECGKTAACTNGQSCIQNVFNPTAGTANVCVQNQYVNTKIACTNIGGSCGSGAEAGICMYRIDGIQKSTVCVNPSMMPGGPSSPSNQTCKTNADCTAEAGFSYCIINPGTNKGQCFSQKNIYTDMDSPSLTKCLGSTDASCTCDIPGKQSCEPTGKSSLCAPYIGGTSGAAIPPNVCIKYEAGGAALGSGQAYMEIDPFTERTERLAPNIQIDIPGLDLTGKIDGEIQGNGRVYHTDYLSRYIDAAAKWLIGFGVVIAVLALMYAGLRWMTAFGNLGAVKSAKEMIMNAVIGIIMLVGAYTLLYVINPELTKLSSISIFAPKQQVLELPPEADDGTPDIPGQAPVFTDSGKPLRVCNSKETCAPFCNGSKANPGPTLQKASELGIPKPESLVDPVDKLDVYIKKHVPGCKIKDTKNSGERFADCGVYFRGPADQRLVLPGVVEGIAIAAAKAKAKGYVISIGSSYRSPLKQMDNVCVHVAKGEEKPCGAEVACPFGSPHMNGYAADLCLAEPGTYKTKCLTPPTGTAKACATNTQIILNDPNLKMLNDIMFSAGWWRYCKELWHFEYVQNPKAFRTKSY